MALALVVAASDEEPRHGVRGVEVAPVQDRLPQRDGHRLIDRLRELRAATGERRLVAPHEGAEPVEPLLRGEPVGRNLLPHPRFLRLVLSATQEVSMRQAFAPVAVSVPRRALAAVSLVSALAVAPAVAAPAVAGAQPGAAHTPTGGRGPAALKWGPAPAVFPKGARMAVVSGDPGASGPYVVQLAMPNGYRIAPHFHPADEHLRIESGAFRVGMGDTFDAKKMKRLTRGDTITAPAQMHHYAEARGRTVVEVSGNGPFRLTYVNPADKPKM